MAKALNDCATIESGIMCTIHAYTGDQMILHMSEGTVEANGKTYSCTKLPEYMQNILNQGGLIASLNKEEK